MSDYEAAIEAVAGATDEAEARRLYDEIYFPLALARMRAEARPCEVLVSACGTQPYSIALALARSPATRAVHLIHTKESFEHAQRGVRLAGLTPSARSPRGLDRIQAHYHLVDKAGSTDVYRAVRQAAEDVDPAHMTADITSSTKAMTAGVSAAAAFLRVRQMYIESSPIHPAFRLYGRERAHVVEHPLVVFGDIERAAAERAFNAGDFTLAREAFGRLDAARAPDYHYGARAALCDAYQAWSALQLEAAREHLSAVVRRLDEASTTHTRHESLRRQRDRFAEQAGSLARLVAATARGAQPAFDPGHTRVLLRFMLATARRRRGEPDLAALLTYRALELAVQRRLATHGIDAGAAHYPDGFVARFNAIAEFRYQVGFADQLPEKLSLVSGRIVLQALEDSVFGSVGAKLSAAAFGGKAEGRNKSLFAHGFQRLTTEDLAKFSTFALPMIAATAEADGPPLPDPDPAFDFARFDPPGEAA